MRTSVKTNSCKTPHEPANELNGGCQGSNNTNCNPHVTWGAKASSGEPSSGHFNQGSFNPSTSYPVAWAFGVRCVLDLNFTHCFKSSWFSAPAYGFAALREVGEFWLRCCTVPDSFWRL